MSSFINSQLLPDEEVLYTGKLGYAHFFIPTILAPFLLFIPLMIAAITYKTTEVAITNKRIVLKKGLINIKTREIFFNKVESVQVQQKWYDAILNSGDLILTGTGIGLTKMENMASPFELKNQIVHQINKD